MICKINNLSVKLPSGRTLLENVSYSIHKDDFIVVLGTNGSGKTTMLKAISGSIKYTGHIVIGNSMEIKHTSASDISKYIGVITQNVADSLFMEFSLQQNFQMYAEAFSNGEQSLQDFVNLMQTINPKLEKLFHAKTSTLSGGERQCFLLALNLFFKKNLLLLDEHTSALDPKTATEVMKITAKKLQETQITCIMTTHNLDDAIKYGNKLIAMQSGKIIKVFEKEEKYKLTKLKLLQYCY